METNYFKASNDVFKVGLNGNQGFVYLYLTRCANNSTAAFPSLNNIAKNCGISRPTVIKTLNELENVGLLKKVKRWTKETGNQSNVYTVINPVVKEIGKGSKDILQGVVKDLDGGSKEDLPYKELPYKEPVDKELYINNIDEFNQFWELYPKKNGKQKALKKWKSYKIDINEVLKGTQRYIDYCKSFEPNRYYMDGSTFVNNRSWEDDWEITKGGQAYGKHRGNRQQDRSGQVSEKSGQAESSSSTNKWLSMSGV